MARPVGRAAKAETDALLDAEILSWSRTHGVFAGISLQGATCRQDIDDNMDLYGKELTNGELIQSNAAVPQAAKKLISYLDKLSRGASRAPPLETSTESGMQTQQVIPLIDPQAKPQ